MTRSRNIRVKFMKFSEVVTRKVLQCLQPNRYDNKGFLSFVVFLVENFRILPKKSQNVTIWW